MTPNSRWRRPGFVGTAFVVALGLLGIAGFVAQRATGDLATIPTVAPTVTTAPPALPPSLTPSPIDPAPSTSTATISTPPGVLATLDVIGVPADQRDRLLPVQGADAVGIDQVAAWSVVIDGSTGVLPTCGDPLVVCSEAGPGPSPGRFHVVVFALPTPITLGAADAPTLGLATRAEGPLIDEPGDPNEDTTGAVEADLAAETLTSRTWTGSGYEAAPAEGRAVVTESGDVVVLVVPAPDPALPFRVWVAWPGATPQRLPDRALFASTDTPVPTP